MIKVIYKSSATLHLLFHQEHLNYVSEISQEEIFILDPELIVMTTAGTSPSAALDPDSTPVNSR